MKSFFTQTAREKAGTIDGLNLFFGALLGANLGTIGRLPLSDYAHLIFILAGTVVGLRIVSTSERRIYALLTLALYVAFLASIVLLPERRPKGMPEEDLFRLAATVAIWVVAIVAMEFWPVRDVSGNSGARARDDQA